ncbi:MAG: beta-galactosidase [Vulcanimicrobiota bacterium]
MNKITVTACVMIILLLTALCSPVYSQSTMKFNEKVLWIQLGNQIKDVDAAMLQKIADCGFGKIVLLHSSINEQGYFPVLKSIVKRCHARGIAVSLGTLVFKDTYQKPYWEKHPELRKCDQNGKYTENKYYHYQICPNNPANHEYIAGLLLRKADEADVDEIHIDYECTGCYCPYCVSEFDRQCKKDARTIDPTDPDWLKWRSRKTRDFFEVLSRRSCNYPPGYRISATAPILGVPGGFTVYGIDVRYDDLTQYVDEFVPMIYLSGTQPASKAGECHAAIQRRCLNKYVIPGIIINEEGTTVIKSGPRVMEELESVYQKGARSIGIFEVRYINDELKEVLKNI